MTHWTAIVEATVRGLDADRHSMISQRIRGPVLHDRDTGRLEVTLSRFGAPDLDSAVKRALTTVRDACRAAGVSPTLWNVRVLPTDAFVAEVERPPGADLLGMSEIGALLGVSRQRAAELAATRGDFPPPIARLAAGPVYTRASVEAFAERWPRQRTGRPRKTA